MTIQVDHNRVAHTLANHPNHLRIRKLIWALCYQQWENDPHRLSIQELGPLVEYMQAAFPRLEDIQTALSQIVKGLNKQTEYQQVANFIITQFSSLYAPVTVVTQRFTTQQTSLDEVAQTIAWHENGSRMQQLLLLLCRQRWEDNSTKLAAISTRSLLQEAYDLAPSFDRLQELLHDVVEATDGQMAYIWAADALSELMWKIYTTPLTNDSTTLETTFNPSAFLTHVPADASTIAIESGQNPAAPASNSDNLPTVPLESLPNLNVDPLTPNFGENHVSENHVSENQRELPGAVNQPGPVASVQADPFELRLEIIKQVNPLRVKIVLFSVLHYPFDFSYQSWSDLRTHSLISLIDQICLTYKAVDTIESKLITTAHGLHDPDQTLQAVQVIIRALRRQNYCVWIQA